jgi:Flp pilus assembly protein TadG
MRNQAPRSSRARKATATVEFAVIAPVFLLILLGTIETCSMIFLQQSLEIAAFEGSRVAIVQKSTRDGVERAINTILGPRRVRDYVVRITPNDFQSASYGTFIKIEVTAKCESNSMLPPIFYGGSTSTGAVEMMKEY